MCYLTLPTYRLHYRMDGNVAEKPRLTLCNSLGTDLHMWDGQIAELSPHLGRIATPVLAISGSEDPVCTPADLQAIARNLPNGHQLSLPGRPIVNVESPALFNAAVLDFVRV